MEADIEKVDNTPLEEEEDANIVFKAIGKKAAKYAEIGRNFGLAPSIIETIKENHPGDNSKALQDIIIMWIRQDFNTKKFGVPSWRKVVQVISGFDKLLAKKIAVDHFVNTTGEIPEQTEQQQSEPSTLSSNDSTNDLELVEDACMYPESPKVATDGGPRSRAAKTKPVKKLVPPEEFEPFDRKSCLRKPLEFVKPLGTVYPIAKVDEVKAMPLSGAYEMKPGCHGLAVIITNENFSVRSLGTRRGTGVDEENLKIVLRFLGYKVHMYHDVDSDGMFAIFKKVQQFDHTPYDSFICCILSHGTKDAILASNSIQVNIADLTGELNGDKCPNLAGKPKLFFIQACRGDKLQKRVTVDGESLPNTSDFFFSFAVPLGYKAFQHSEKGSWYVTELCRAIGEHAIYAPLIEIMHLVHQRVAKKCVRFGKGDNDIAIQAPELVYRLRKHVFFFS